MNPYVVDLTNLRIQKAMLNLGIDSIEMIRKPIEDFKDKDTSEEVQIVRYNFYKRKQQELVRQIKEYIKDELMRGLEKSIQGKKQESVSNEILITSVTYPERKASTRPKIRNKDIINKALIEAKEAINYKKILDNKLKQGVELREKAQSALAKSRMKFYEFREKQKENLEKIRNAEQNKLSKTLSGYYSVSPTSFSYKKKPNVYSKTQSRASSIVDLDIESQIKKYEQKMIKSKNLHDLFTQTKKNAASKLLERNFRYSKAMENEEKILSERLTKYVNKNKTAEIRRSEHKRLQSENRERLREKHDEKRLKAQCRVKEKEEFDIEKAKRIEKRLEISNGILEKKNLDWKKELEIRNEMQRLKDEEALSNAERKKRVMYELYRKFRRENVIEKQKSDNERIDIMKKYREEEIKKKMKMAIKSMREKEKIREILVMLKKSPESKIMKKKNDSFTVKNGEDLLGE
ncbi:hypothetical protein SteCoe_25190 [Stentor coeruleus]|uniref:Uncharacterized protein n=1 Tax=Stentor coeruleus TaxID=5963 RepID=A0A1R2BFT2_9CILI|nr:hypothetical protein SteCoe_25190 [Stentor coeruleus]